MLLSTLLLSQLSFTIKNSEVPPEFNFSKKSYQIEENTSHRDLTSLIDNAAQNVHASNFQAECGGSLKNNIESSTVSAS